MIRETNTPPAVLVIGGGQAGLAMGYHLRQAALPFRILDSARRTGQSWRERWDGLRLFTPARYSSLPGLPFPAAPEHYPGKDEVAAYLEAYAAHFALPVAAGDPVVSLTRADGGYRATTASGRVHAAPQVVVATGPFQTPWVPPCAAGLSSAIQQMHSAAYRRPEDVAGDEVLVVGGGNSGVQIAQELSATHRVTLSVGARMPRLPERMLGRSIFWWLQRMGMLDVSVESALGRRMSRTETLIGTSPRTLARDGVLRVVGRVEEARDGEIRTADGAVIHPDAVIWATGYRPDHGWIDPDLFRPAGHVGQRRGVTTAPGLYFLGLPWMHTRGSALIGWVGRDAEYLLGHIVRRAAARTAADQPDVTTRS